MVKASQYRYPRQMPYFVIQRDPASFPFAKAVVVQADSSVTTGEKFQLLRDDRVCWTAPAADVTDATEYGTQLAADERLKELRKWRSGRSTVSVTEGSAAPRGSMRTNQGGRDHAQSSGRGIAEGVSIRINEN